MSRIVRAALTETRNAFAEMPARVEDLHQIADRLEEIRAANVAHNVALASTAADEGCAVVCFGELFTGPYFALDENELWRGLAEDARSGPTVTELSSLARDRELVIVAPVYELCGDTGSRFNTAVVIDATGEVLGKYRKTHIPAGTNEQGSFHETFYYARSDGNLGAGTRNVSANRFFPVFETAAGRIGVAICYDRHFEGCVSTLARNGAQIVFSPAVTFGAKSRRMWELEFDVDACRHNVFIGGSNRRGPEAPWNQEYFGASLFVGPNGRCERVGDPGRERELVVADLNLDELERGDPSGWNLGRDKRREIFED